MPWWDIFKSKSETTADKTPTSVKNDASPPPPSAPPAPPLSLADRMRIEKERQEKAEAEAAVAAEQARIAAADKERADAARREAEKAAEEQEQLDILKSLIAHALDIDVNPTTNPTQVEGMWFALYECRIGSRIEISNDRDERSDRSYPVKGPALFWCPPCSNCGKPNPAFMHVKSFDGAAWNSRPFFLASPDYNAKGRLQPLKERGVAVDKLTSYIREMEQGKHTEDYKRFCPSCRQKKT